LLEAVKSGITTQYGATFARMLSDLPVMTCSVVPVWVADESR